MAGVDAVHELDARGQMTGGGAVVDDRPAAPRLEPGPHRPHADLALERGGDAIGGLQPIGRRVLPVRVEIDEAGSDHQAVGVDHLAAGDRLLGDARDAPAAHADVADGVEARGGIDDAPAGDDQIEVLCRGADGAERGEQDDERGGEGRAGLVSTCARE